MHSSMTRHIVATSSAVGSPMSQPRAYSRIVPPPTNEPMLSETPRSSTASSHSRNRVQPRAFSPHSSGTPAATRLERIGSLIRPPNGDGVQPSPIISVVTPWWAFESNRPSANSGMIECDLYVDEAGTDDVAGRVDHLGSVGRVNPPARRNSRDLVTSQRDISVEPRVAGAIHDLATTNQDIVCHRFSLIPFCNLATHSTHYDRRRR